MYFSPISAGTVFSSMNKRCQNFITESRSSVPFSPGVLWQRRRISGNAVDCLQTLQAQEGWSWGGEHAPVRIQYCLLRWETSLSLNLGPRFSEHNTYDYMLIAQSASSVKLHMLQKMAQFHFFFLPLLYTDCIFFHGSLTCTYQTWPIFQCIYSVFHSEDNSMCLSKIKCISNVSQCDHSLDAFNLHTNRYVH